MGGADKGLLPLHGRPLIAWVLEAVAPQADEVLISANRNLDAYREYGYPVLPDDSAESLGPLAGLARALASAVHPLVLCVPCDTPFLPADLALRLHDALDERQAHIAIAATDEHVHRTVCLCRRDLLPGLKQFLASGGRRVGAWQEGLKSVEVHFGDAENFRNVNTPQALSDIPAMPAWCKE
jgi:molybdopterin-guanine dinucleotide biosynthesis protein A